MDTTWISKTKQKRWFGALLAAVVLMCGHSASAATMSLGSVNVGSGKSATVPLTVDSGTSALGGYLITIGFNTNLVTFTGAAGGTGEFSAPPGTVNTGTPGQITIIHQQTSSLTSPTGAVVVSQISFTAIGAGGNTAVLSILAAAADNTDGQALPITSTNNGAINILDAPVANFTGNPTVGLHPLTVTFTDTSTGNITNRFWTFGDGGTTNTLATTVLHTYPVAGTNDVSLTVSGIGGTNTFTRSNYIIVTNRAPQLAVTPVSRAFGSITIGQSSTLAFQVINTGEITLTGTASVPAPYSISSGASYNVLGGQTSFVNVTFSPVAAGSFNNNVIFASNGGNSTNAVTGTGLTQANLSVTPATLNFPTIAIGTTAQLSFLVSNTGQSPLSGSATVNAGPFTIVGGTPFSLPGLGSTNLVVSFTPPTATVFSNSISFTSNGGNLNNAIVGIGAIIPAAGFTGSPTNGLAPLTVTFTDTSIGTIANRFWNFGDGGTLNTTATSVTHTYGVAGTNTVTLIVTGPVGVSTNVRAAYVSVLVYPPGDVNGTYSVTTGDSLLINQVAANLRATNSPAFLGAGYANGDVNQDGLVTTGDSLLINQVAAGLRAYVVTKILPASRSNNVPTTVTIYGIGFPTNTVTGITIGPPVNLNLNNIVVISREQIQAVVPAGGGVGTGTVSVTASPSTGATSFGKFNNQ